MDAILSGLNSFQQEAVLANAGPVLILAGAGSGKTKVITHKIAYLVKREGISPEAILAVTFTNKAASELKERVEKFLGKTKGLSASTFHAFGVRFLKEEISRLGYLPKFSIYSSSDTESLLKNIILDLKLDEEKYSVKILSYLISKAKNNLQSPEKMTGLMDAVPREAYQHYQERLKGLNAVDFDDLIYLTVKLLTEHQDILDKWSKRFAYIMVDEYQDTNHSQYLLMKLLSSHHGNICVVGDDDQSIYAFRGANVENILRFERDFPSARMIVLGINYRSTPAIIEAAYHLIGHNKERHTKDVKAHNPEGELITYFDSLDAREEAELIAAEIFENRISRQVPYHDQAVLCRTNTQMRTFEEVFREKSIPYKLIGGYSFFDRKEIKDVLSYLKLIHNPSDNLSFLRTINFPKRGIGPKTMEDVMKAAVAHNLSFFDAVPSLSRISDIGKPLVHKLELFHELITRYQERFSKEPLGGVFKDFLKDLEIFEEYERVYKEEAPYRVRSLESLIEMAGRYEKKRKQSGEFPDLEHFLADLSLFNKEDEEEENEENKVLVMTIHASKGLEFEVVFIAGMEEGFLPHERSIDEGAKAIEEERRLTYVAMTRAKKKLFLSSASTRKVFGHEVEREPSRFLKELPAHLVSDSFYAADTPGGAPKSDEEIAEDYLKKLKDLIS